MPASPRWLSHINEICAELSSLPRPFVDRATAEAVLGVGRRRAQQLLAPCISDHVGSNGLADREVFIRHLRALAAGEDRDFERGRRRRVASVLDGLRRERLERPQLPVEAPHRILTQELADLPAGVTLAPGHITVEFREPREALEKLLALAMAVSNDFEGFEGVVGIPAPKCGGNTSLPGILDKKP
jgi:hypothetical protein